MKPFTEEARYEYDLNCMSTVVDCGAYEGTFAELIHNKYACTVFCYEPVKSFYDRCVERLKKFPAITVMNCGVAGSTRRARFSIKGDSTGEYADNLETEMVELIDIAGVIEHLGFIDLLKLNIEGAEFEVLERILGLSLQTQLGNIQVQAHPCVPDFEARWKFIRSELLKTHELTFDAPWCWENYELRKS